MTDFAATKALFHIPEGTIYLDGNSLGPMPVSALERATSVISDEWAAQLIRAWNGADWFSLPSRVGARIAPLIGAPPHAVVTGDTLSIKVFQALSAALQMRPGRRVVLSDNGNFPTDLYMAQGLLTKLGPEYSLRVVDPEDVERSITDDVAAVMLTHVDYRTGRMHDMDKITARTHAAGAVSIWDLAHSAGAMPVDMQGCQAEFAVGCTYKYLNGGPGAPAFIYIRPDLSNVVDPILAGWMGHAKPFDFDLDYRPADGVERMRVGTPPIVQLSILDEALKIWENVNLHALRKKSVDLCELFIAGVEAQCPELTLSSPRDPAQRGSQVSFTFEHGFSTMQALAARGVIGDFRAPNVMRFGFTPLYTDEADVTRAIEIIRQVVSKREYARPEFQVRGSVT
ncbi:kynureninase [Ruegeria pomeroyi]|nr:kynureninase [Ruegeria pomeroyi]MCE8556266.1 kynureninase [Ruegeria pomeroyi]